MATTAHGSLDVQHDDDASRYVLRRSGEPVGVLDYRRDGELVTIFHTEINPQVRGKGLGAVLVRDALEDLRGHGCTVRPTCWYVREFMDRNDEFADLLES